VEANYFLGVLRLHKKPYCVGRKEERKEGRKILPLVLLLKTAFFQRCS
jgi:hypothetical protein